jgi:hypothetical protein
VQQPGRALDVGEEEGDGAGRERGAHDGIIRREQRPGKTHASGHSRTLGHATVASDSNRRIESATQTCQEHRLALQRTVRSRRRTAQAASGRAEPLLVEHVVVDAFVQPADLCSFGARVVGKRFHQA